MPPCPPVHHPPDDDPDRRGADPVTLRLTPDEVTEVLRELEDDGVPPASARTADVLVRAFRVIRERGGRPGGRAGTAHARSEDARP